MPALHFHSLWWALAHAKLLAGRVIVQTYQPDHYAIRAAADHDYTSFYLEEIRYRSRQHALTHPRAEAVGTNHSLMPKLIPNRLAPTPCA